MDDVGESSLPELFNPQGVSFQTSKIEYVTIISETNVDAVCWADVFECKEEQNSCIYTKSSGSKPAALFNNTLVLDRLRQLFINY